MIQDLGFYLSVFRRRFVYFLLVATLVTAAAVATALMLPASYRVESKLLVEGSQIPSTLADTTIETAATEQLRIIEQRLMTRANLLDIERRLHVLKDSSDMAADDIVDAMRAKSELTLQAGQDQATVMSVAFTADDPQKAVDVVNEYVTLILKENVEMRTQRAGQTLDFFRQEVKQLGDALGEASAKIVDFQNRNSDALPDTLEFRLTQQSQVQQQIGTLERDITSLRDQKDRLVAVFKTTGRVGTTSDQLLTPEAQQLKDLQNQLTQAEGIYAPDSPKVKLLRVRIEQLEKIVAAQSPSTQSADPAQTMLDIQLSDMDARIKSLEQQKADAEKQLAALTESIDRTSQNKVELDALQRDYDIIQGQYNVAVDRLSKAATGERIELLSKGERITVIDAATPPNRPTSPNRTLIAAGGLAAGIMLGLATVVLIELLNNAVRRPKDLVTAFGITPLATIPYMRTPSEAVVRRVTILTSFLAVVIGIPVLLYA
ncbi:MAG: lipopolysaccharide biosynthesis protein, partial [Rhodobacteraceae bacterium]|nr:lipopolysaccharide biosynthesis protein [Paracoccaceae bacterium]